MISVVIVNYNLSQEILACLDSFDRHPSQEEFEIIVVDNQSSDDMLPVLRERLEQNTHCRLIPLNENRGFGTACNAGAEAANGEYLCFLNPDTEIKNDLLHDLRESQRETSADLIGPAYGPAKLLEYNAGVFPSVVLEALNVLLIGRYLEALYMGIRRRFSRERPLPVDWVLGACLFLSRDRFRQLNGFDESFFLFFEEMDLCRRLKRQGGRVVFSPACELDHIGSVSGKRDYVRFTDRFYRGKIRYLCKHSEGVRKWLFLLLVDLQIRVQSILWSLPGLRRGEKAQQKRAGFRLASRFLKEFPAQRMNP